MKPRFGHQAWPPEGPDGMDNDKKELFRNLGMISSMGISFVVAIAMGVYFGLKLDEWFGTKPWLFYIFMLFGIAAGFRNIFIIAGREIKRGDRNDTGTGQGS